MAQFGTIITNIGLAKITNAQVTQDTVDLMHIALGDGGGAYYVPSQSQTALKNELWRGVIADMKVDENNPNRISISAYISSSEGGFTIREIGLFDTENNLIALSLYPEQYKPQLSEGVSEDVLIHFEIETSNASVVNLAVDPTIIIASRKYVDEKVASAIGSVGTNLSELQQQLNEHLDKNATGAHSPKNVGLGNVQNYGVATQTEAESGTSNSKYMTPQRTKQAIEKIAKEVVNRQTNPRDETTDPNLFSNLRSGEVLLCKHPNAPNSIDWWQISTYFGVSNINHIQVAINWNNPSDVIYIRRSSGNNTWSDWRSILEGFTMKGILKAHPNTSYTVPQVRNVILSTANPTGGNDGDIWIKYK